MNERLFIQPPEIAEANERIVFLAGPVQGAPEWQPEAAQLIHDIDDSIIVASPRRDYEKDGIDFVYEKQVNWEKEFLKRAGEAGVIAFWLADQVTPTPGRAYGQTSRFELGEWYARHEIMGAKLVIGSEPNFGNIRYFKQKFSTNEATQDVPFVDSLPELARTAVELLEGVRKKQAFMR